MRWFIFAIAMLLPGEPWWIGLPSGVDGNLRGVSVVVQRRGTTLWAAGSKGTVIVSTDGGTTWEKAAIPNGETLDYRGVQAFESGIAYVRSSGVGEKSKIFKTTDTG